MTSNTIVTGNETLAPTVIPSQGIDQSTQTLLIGIMVGVVGVLIFLLVCVIVPCMFPFPSADQRAQREREEQEEAALPIDPERIKRRNQTIKDWLIIQTVVGAENHDGEDQPQESDDGSDTERKDRNGCEICMEEFKIGDSVAWSTECDHVHHLKCLQEWLLKKRDCPYCRQTVLPVDASDEYDVVELMIAKEIRQANTSYCLQKGLVVTNKPAVLKIPGVTPRPIDGGHVAGEEMVVEPPVVAPGRQEGENSLGLIIEPPLRGRLVHNGHESVRDEESPSSND